MIFFYAKYFFLRSEGLCLSSRHRNESIAGYATVSTTQNTDKKTSQYSDIIKSSLLGLVLLTLAGCTSMIAHTTIDPYMSNKEKRNQLELLAEQYCKEKQLSSTMSQVIVLPDYIFTTDGCSRWFDKSWVSCCVVHDIMYWCGGSDEDREEADQIIMECANKKASFMGEIIYPGVRIGGLPWLPTPWRWGYGWKEWPRGYESSNNKQSIKRILKKLRIPEIVEEQLSKKPK